MFADLFDLKSLYFNAAYMGPLPKRAQKLIDVALKRAADPAFLHFEDWFNQPEKTRARFASLLRCPNDNIALSTSVSELVSHLANGVDLKSGDEVLLLKNDYPSMVLPWMVMSELKGIRLHFLELEDFLDPKRFKGKITARTRVAGCSHVMFSTGMQLPVAELGAIARTADVLFVSDVSQSFGGMQIAPEILKNVDILVGVAYKWLLGPYGTAFGYFSNRALENVRRTHASWIASPNSTRSESLTNYTTETTAGARKFDRGQSPCFFTNAGLEGALGTLEEIGLKKVEAHNAGLTEYFLAHLPKDYEVAAPKELRSNIVCVKPPEGNALELKTKLAEQKIDVSVREGNVRLSFHIFNSKQQIEVLLKELRA